MSNSKTVIELSADRTTLLSCFDNDHTANDTKNMRMLSAVEAEIVRSTFGTDTERLAGLGMLLDMGDTPRGFDNFKTALFRRMQEFA